MFITNSSASAGATSSPPGWRPQALTTSVAARSTANAPATQNDAAGGSSVTASGMPARNRTSAPRQLFQRSSSARGDRKSTRLNSSHLVISYAVFCLKKKNKVIILFFFNKKKIKKKNK